LRLSKDLVNQESGNALRAPRFDGSDKRRGASRKFTHANDFMALSALLRNFYAPSARDREALLGVEETPVATTGGSADSPFRIQPRRGEKQRKAKGMFRMAKRNVSPLRHKPLKSLWALNQ
jgi:hypothetical protein